MNYDFVFDLNNKVAIKTCDIKPTEVTQTTTQWLYASNNKYATEFIDNNKTGKWMLFCLASQANQVWSEIKDGITDGRFWHAKISTVDPKNPTHAVMIYTKNYEDINDVIQVLETLEKSGGLIAEKIARQTIYYKPDYLTREGVYSGGKKRAWLYASDTIRKQDAEKKASQIITVKKQDNNSIKTSITPQQTILFFVPTAKESPKFSLNKLIELKGENRTFGGNNLYVDLVPNSCWFTNVRSEVHPSAWEHLRKLVYERAANQCECCKAKVPLEAHERWHYDEKTKIQKLMRIIALCQPCHEATHMGLARRLGNGERAKQHLMRVTGITVDQANTHIQQAFTQWKERNKYEWDLDLSIITASGIPLKAKTTNQSRKEIAKEKLEKINLQSQEKTYFSKQPSGQKRKAEVLNDGEDESTQLRRYTNSS